MCVICVVVHSCVLCVGVWFAYCVCDVIVCIALVTMSVVNGWRVLFVVFASWACFGMCVVHARC